MMQVRNKLEPEIEEEQYGFVKRENTNAIYRLRTIIDGALEVQKVIIYASLTTPRHLAEYDMMK